MHHLGDIQKISGYDIEPVDVVTGGSPCQDFSIAKGNRTGLEGERSGLFMEYVRVVKEMRDADRVLRGRTGIDVRPRFMVVENVSGIFSANGGKDFQAVLTEIVRIVQPNAPDVPLPRGRWNKAGCIYGMGRDGQPFSIGWRVHNSEFWGVAQRRVRVSIVADFGAASAGEILFVRKSLFGNNSESQWQRKSVTQGTGNGSERTDRVVESEGEDFGDGFTEYSCRERERAESYSIGNGQLHDAMSISKEVCKTLNCMEDPMKVLIADAK